MQKLRTRSWLFGRSSGSPAVRLGLEEFDKLKSYPTDAMEQASLRQLVEQLAKRVDNLESEVRFLRSLNGLQTEENDADHAAAAEDTVVDLTEPSAEDERVFAELGFLERVKATRDARGKKADDKATGMNADVEEELQTVPEEEVVVDNAAEDDDDHKKVLDRSIKLRLKPHQKIGVRFIYNILRDGRGFVLGDAMGLGKTLQILTALHMLIAARRATSTRASTATASLRALIVCPTMLLRHWESEVTQFNSWLSSSATPLPQPWVIDAALPPGIRMETLRTWSRRGGILLVGYDMLRELCGTTVGHELLCLHPGADVMVLDEGHRIRNFASSLHSVLSFVQVRSKVRSNIDCFDNRHRLTASCRRSFSVAFRCRTTLRSSIRCSSSSCPTSFIPCSVH